MEPKRKCGNQTTLRRLLTNQLPGNFNGRISQLLNTHCPAFGYWLIQRLMANCSWIGSGRLVVQMARFEILRYFSLIFAQAKHYLASLCASDISTFCLILSKAVSVLFSPVAAESTTTIRN